MSISYLQPSPIAPSAPPVATSGVVHWMRTNLFNGPLNTILTLIVGYIVVTSLPDLIRFYLIDAVWSGTDRDACLADKVGRPVGACWAYIADRWQYFVYGSYPLPDRWRVNIVFVMFAIGVVWMLWQSVPYKTVGALFFFVIMPATAWALLFGGTRSTGVVLYLSAALGLWAIWSDLQSRRKTGVSAFSQPDTWIRYALIAGMGLFAFSVSPQGLPRVDTSLWGGILVTLVISAVGIVFSLPLGIALALGRRSKLPIVKLLSVIFIEFVRGVPLITVLFMANTMLPLFVPQEWSPDRLLRPLIGVALFAAAYMAEVVRGGLQAMPKGQFEGAMSLGLGYGQMMRLIILPQALRIVIPGIVNTFIGLFKDTTLVVIVGIFDFLRTIEATLVDPTWATPTTRATGYAFAGLFYFICCWGMSRYSLWVERKLAAGQKR
ncbi:MAG: amino acid ABC transporter permease [Bosea sp. (in: a-proteobacteria)]